MDQSIQYVIVQEDAQDGSNEVSGIQREELEGAIEALAQQSSLLRQRDGGGGITSGGPQQFQIVKDDGKGGTTTTTIVLMDEGSAGQSINLQNLKTNPDGTSSTAQSHQTRQDIVSILPERSVTEGNLNCIYLCFIGNNKKIATFRHCELDILFYLYLRCQLRNK